MTESQDIWRPWREFLKAMPPPVGPHIQRIENSAGRGQPDVEACWHGVQAWIELKIVKGNRLIFRPAQPDWIRKRWATGGRVYVLARKADVLYLFPAAIVNDPVYNGSIKPIFVTKIPFDWAGLQKTIFAARVTLAA